MAVGLKYAEGFTKPTASAATLLAAAVSSALLSYALKPLPVGTAYAI